MQPGLNLAAASPDKEIVVMATFTLAKFPVVMERGGVPVPKVESTEGAQDNGGEGRELGEKDERGGHELRTKLS